MSLNTDIFASTDLVNNNNITNSNADWANFDKFQGATEATTVNVPNETDDDWAEFQSNTDDQIETPLENVNTLISACFPCEPSTTMDNSTMFELPNFTTFNDETKQIPCLEQSLSLWKHLSPISTDPIGIQHQWRRSNIEHLFHRALKVSSSTISNNSNRIQENDKEKIDSETASIDINDLSTLATTSCSIDDNLFQVNSRSYSPCPIKTMDLFPGSSKLSIDESKPVVNTIPNFTFINPKALMSSTQINRVD